MDDSRRARSSQESVERRKLEARSLPPLAQVDSINTYSVSRPSGGRDEMPKVRAKRASRSTRAPRPPRRFPHASESVQTLPETPAPATRPPVLPAEEVVSHWSRPIDVVPEEADLALPGAWTLSERDTGSSGMTQWVPPGTQQPPPDARSLPSLPSLPGLPSLPSLPSLKQHPVARPVVEAIQFPGPPESTRRVAPRMWSESGTSLPEARVGRWVMTSVITLCLLAASLVVVAIWLSV